MLFYLLTLCFTCFVQVVVAQNSETEVRLFNSVHFTAQGNASSLSLSYERSFPLSPSVFFSGSVGIGFNQKFLIINSSEGTPVYITSPHYFTFSVGREMHFAELGVGGTFLGGNTTENYFGYPIIGYRYISRSRRYLFRAFATYPHSGIHTRDILYIPFGISFGFRF